MHRLHAKHISLTRKHPNAPGLVLTYSQCMWVAQLDRRLTLGTRVTVLGPAERMMINVQHGELLFDTEPRMVFFGAFHDLFAGDSVVGLGRLLVVFVGFAQD